MRVPCWQTRDDLGCKGLSMPAYTFQTDPLVQYLIEEPEFNLE